MLQIKVVYMTDWLKFFAFSCVCFFGAVWSQGVPIYNVQVVSEPSGLTFKVYDSTGKERVSGTTPKELRVRKSTKNLTFKLFRDGVVVDQEKRSRFNSHSKVTLKAPKNKPVYQEQPATSPVKKETAKPAAIYDLKIVSSPSRLQFKVFDAYGQEKASGTTPTDLKVRSTTKNLTFKLYQDGKVVAQEKRSRFFAHTKIQLNAKQKKDQTEKKSSDTKPKGGTTYKVQVESDPLGLLFKGFDDKGKLLYEGITPTELRIPETQKNVTFKVYLKGQLIGEQKKARFTSNTTIAFDDLGDKALTEDEKLVKEGELTIHGLKITSSPSGLKYRVFDAFGNLKTEGVTPVSLSVRSSTKNLSFKLYQDDKVVATKRVKEFYSDTKVHLDAKSAQEPVEKESSTKTYQASITSEPSGLAFKVFDSKGVEKASGKTPATLNFPTYDRNLVYKLYEGGKVIAEKKKLRIFGNVNIALTKPAVAPITPPAPENVDTAPEKKEAAPKTYQATITSEPSGLTFKVFDTQGLQKASGKTPATIDLPTSDRNLVYKLYQGGQVIAEKKKLRLFGNVNIDWKAPPKPVAESQPEKEEKAKPWFNKDSFQSAKTLTVTSKPEALSFKVLDQGGNTLIQGITPMSSKFKATGQSLKIVLYYKGKPVTSQSIRSFDEDALINFVAE